MNIDLQQAENLIRNNKEIAYIKRYTDNIYVDKDEMVPFADETFKSICIDLLHSANINLYSDNSIIYEELEYINTGNLLNNALASSKWSNVTSLRDLRYFSNVKAIADQDNDNEVFKNITEIDMCHITSIGTYAFLDNPGLTLYNTYNITSIGSHAFDSAVIQGMNISFNSLSSLGEYAFYNSQFNSIINLGAVQNISAHCFENAVFNNITFNANNTSISNYVFKGASINHLTGEENITTIGSNVFENAITDMDVNFPSLVSIGNNVFKNCTIANVKSLGSIAAIPEYTFYNCNNLKKIEIPSDVTTIKTHAFDGCNLLTVLEFPLSVTTIESYAIANCSRLRNIKSLGSITAFTENMVYNCPELQIVYFPDNIEDWEVTAFVNCSKLKTLANIKNYSYLDRCFSGCPVDTIWLSDDLTEVTDDGIQVCDEQFIKVIKLNHYVTDNSYHYYDTSWSPTAIQDMTELTTIDADNNVFNNDNYKSIDYIVNNAPNKMTILHAAAAYPIGQNTNNIETVSISSMAYSGGQPTYNIENVILEDNIDVSIYHYFSMNTMQTYNIYVGKYVNTIEMQSMASMNPDTDTRIINIDFSNALNLKVIQNGAFCGGKPIYNIPVWPKNIEAIQYSAFYNGSFNYNIVIPENTKYVQNGAFYYNDMHGNNIVISHNTDASILNSFNFIKNIGKIKIFDTPNYNLKVLSNAFNNVSTYNEQPLHFDNFYIPENCKISQCFYVNHGITIDNLVFPSIYDTNTSDIFNIAPYVTNIYLPDTIVNSFNANTNSVNIWNISDSISYYNIQSIANTRSLVKSVHFKPGAKSLDSNMFSNMQNLKEVEFADSIEEIKMECFSNCINLDVSIMPQNIKQLSYGAFNNCINISQLNLQNVEILQAAFTNCQGLTEVIIPSSFDGSKISSGNGSSAFLNCTNLKKVTLPNNLTTLPYAMFCNCNNLYDINIENITSLNASSLKNTSVNIDLSTCSITNIGDHALENTLTIYKPNLTLSPTITFVGKYALCASTYNSKKSMLRSVTLSPNMDTLSEGVLANHTYLGTVNNTENIKVFDTSCLGNTYINLLGANASTRECILSNQPIKKIGKSIFYETTLYRSMEKFDISNTYDGSTYSLQTVCNSTSTTSNGYNCEINISNSGVTYIDSSAFLFSFDPRYYTYNVKLNISNQKNYINLSQKCIRNTSKRSRNIKMHNGTGSWGNGNMNLTIDIDASNTSLGNIPVIDSSANVYWINVPLGEHVYIDPSTDFKVPYPTSAQGHTEAINGEDTSVYGINTLHLGPHMKDSINYGYVSLGNYSGTTIWNCSRCIDFSQSSFTTIPTYFGGSYGTSIYPIEIILGNNITTIPQAAFQKSYMLKKVDIGTGIQSIGFYAFVDTPVEILICRATTPPSVGTGHNNYRLGLYHQNLTKTGCGIFVPDESVDAYKSTWSIINIGGSEVHPASYYIHPLSELEG